MRLRRITINPHQMGGVPCIRGLRIPVSTIVAMMADSMSQEEVLRAFPDLERDDIREALLYAAETAQHREVTPGPQQMRFLIDNALSPVRNPSHHEQVTKALIGVNARHGPTLRRLAE